MSVRPPYPAKAAPTTTKHRRLGRGLASIMANTKSDPEPPVEIRPAAVTAAVDPRYEPVGPEVAPGSDHAPSGQTVDIPITAIRPNPYQPRRSFDTAELKRLTQSIRRQGLLQPLLVARAQARISRSALPS